MSKKRAPSIKCKHCYHVIFYDETPPFGDKPEWRHKHMLHNENCECRNPEPDLRPIQKQLRKDLDKVMKDYEENHPRIDASRGWNSLTVEEMYRPFTI